LNAAKVSYTSIVPPLPATSEKRREYSYPRSAHPSSRTSCSGLGFAGHDRPPPFLPRAQTVMRRRARKLRHVRWEIVRDRHVLAAEFGASARRAVPGLRESDNRRPVRPSSITRYGAALLGQAFSIPSTICCWGDAGELCAPAFSSDRFRIRSGRVQRPPWPRYKITPCGPIRTEMRAPDFFEFPVRGNCSARFSR